MIDRSRLSNAFEFVTLASARARQLLNGCTPRIDESAKPMRTAQREVLTGAIGRAEKTDPAAPPVSEPLS